MIVDKAQMEPHFSRCVACRRCLVDDGGDGGSWVPGVVCSRLGYFLQQRRREENASLTLTHCFHWSPIWCMAQGVHVSPPSASGWWLAVPGVLPLARIFSWYSDHPLSLPLSLSLCVSGFLAIAACTPTCVSGSPARPSRAWERPLARTRARAARSSARCCCSRSRRSSRRIGRGSSPRCRCACLLSLSLSWFGPCAFLFFLPFLI